jgi:hypothetical protein
MTDEIDRRKLLAGVAGAGAMALAGCTAEERGSSNSTSGGGASGESLTPPTPPAIPDDEYWAYLIRSHQYQNQALAQLLEG